MKSLTILEAAPQLESLAELAIHGETVLLTSKAGSLVLRPLQQSAPVPIHPPGFFDDIYDEEEIKLTNLAAALAPQTLVP